MTSANETGRMDEGAARYFDGRFATVYRVRLNWCDDCLRIVSAPLDERRDAQPDTPPDAQTAAWSGVPLNVYADAVPGAQTNAESGAQPNIPAGAQPGVQRNAQADIRLNAPPDVQADTLPDVSPDARTSARTNSQTSARTAAPSSDTSLNASPVELACWPFRRIAQGKPDPDGQIALSCKGEAGRVLVAASALPQALRERRRLARRRHAGAFAAGTLALLLFAFVVVVYGPAWAAALIPARAEQKLGEAVEPVIVGDHRACTGAQGQRALDALETRLARAAGLAQPVRVVVDDDARINALSLPGARIVVMRGLIGKARDANELAGIMAHETAHLAHHDPMTMLFRQMGLSLVGAMVADLNGVNVGGIGSQLAALSYSRGMERAADASGVAYLQASGLRSDGLASFLQAFAQREGKHAKDVEFLLDHPDTAGRAQRNRGSAQGESALTATQWQAVRHMCD